MNPPIYLKNEIQSSLIADILIPLLSSALGAGITVFVSWLIFRNTIKEQNSRDELALQNQLDRDNQLFQNQNEIIQTNQKNSEKLKAINIIVELQLILNSMLHRRNAFKVSDINVDQKFDYKNTQWQKLYNSMAEYSDIKNIDTENFEPLFKAEEYILIGKIKILVKNYNKIEIHIDKLNQEIRSFQENVLFKYSKFDDENNTVSAIIDDEISMEYKIRSHEFDSSIILIIKSLDLNIKKAEENLSKATIALHKYFGEDNFLNIGYGIPETLRDK